MLGIIQVLWMEMWNDVCLWNNGNYQWYKRVLSHAICLWDDFNKIMNGTKVPWQIAQIALKYEAYGNYVMQNFELTSP